jgi:hypothetical protein
MKTTTINQEVILLINKAFDFDGFLINPKSRKNKNQAKFFLESGVDFYGQTVNGYDVHNALLIIAYPNKEI